MSNLSVEIIGIDVQSGDRVKDTAEMTVSDFMSHVKQIVNSVAKTGIVHEIEDRENPFTGIAVDALTVQNVDDPMFDDDDDDWEDDCD